MYSLRISPKDSLRISVLQIKNSLDGSRFQFIEFHNVVWNQREVQKNIWAYPLLC